MRAWISALSATLLSLVFVAVLQVPGLGASAASVISNSGQLGAALCASAGCAAAARVVVAVHRDRVLGGRSGRVEPL